jgi:hypothetical protein
VRGLGTVAGLLGFLFSVWGLDLLLRLVPVEIPYWIDFALDWRVFAFAAGASLLTSLLFGLAPAWRVSRTDVQAGLSETARGSSGGRRRQGLRSAFVVAEVALATLLLCGGGLLESAAERSQQWPGLRDRGPAAAGAGPQSCGGPAGGVIPSARPSGRERVISTERERPKTSGFTFSSRRGLNSWSGPCRGSLPTSQWPDRRAGR